MMLVRIGEWDKTEAATETKKLFKIHCIAAQAWQYRQSLRPKINSKRLHLKSSPRKTNCRVQFDYIIIKKTIAAIIIGMEEKITLKPLSANTITLLNGKSPLPYPMVRT